MGTHPSFSSHVSEEAEISIKRVPHPSIRRRRVKIGLSLIREKTCLVMLIKTNQNFNKGAHERRGRARTGWFYSITKSTSMIETNPNTAETLH